MSTARVVEEARSGPSGVRARSPRRRPSPLPGGCGRRGARVRRCGGLRSLKLAATKAGNAPGRRDPGPTASTLPFVDAAAVPAAGRVRAARCARVMLRLSDGGRGGAVHGALGVRVAVDTVFDCSKLEIEPHAFEITSAGDLLVLDSVNSNIYRVQLPLSLSPCDVKQHSYRIWYYMLQKLILAERSSQP